MKFVSKVTFCLFSVFTLILTVAPAGAEEGLSIQTLDEPGWRVTPSDHPQWATSVTYGNGRFVAVGNHANRSGAAVFYSDDGESWHGPTLYGEGGWLEKVIFTGERFVAVGGRTEQTPLILFSDDGIAWSEGTITSGSAEALTSVTHNGNRLVAVGGGGKGVISEDANLWRGVSIDETTSFNDFVGVAYGGGVFLAVGGAGTYSSDDGETWIRQSKTAPLPDDYLDPTGRDLTYINDRFWASGGDEGLFSSFDGSVWLHAGVRFSSSLVKVGNSLVAVGAGDDYYGSINGGDWAVRRTGHSPFRSLASGDGKVVAVGNGQFGVKDIVEPRISAQPSLVGPAVVGGALSLRVYAVGEGPFDYQWLKNDAPISGATESVLRIETLNISHEGEYTVEVSSAVASTVSEPVQVTVLSQPPLVQSGWSVQRLNTIGGVTSIAYGKGRFVGVGDPSAQEPVIFQSRDGQSWLGGYLRGPSESLAKVIFTGEFFVAVGRTWDMKPYLLYSVDGVTWGEGVFDAGSGGGLASVAHADGVLVAVGENLVLRSEDGIHWARVLGQGTAFYGITHAKGAFFAVGATGTYVSEDGWRWSRHSSTNPFPAFVPNGFGRDLVYNNGRYWACGGHVGLSVSLDGRLWNEATRFGSALAEVDGTLLAVGALQTYFGSPDGGHWGEKGNGDFLLHALAVGEDRIVAAGSSERVAVRSRHLGPQISEQPTLVGSVVAGGTFALNARAVGSGPLHYQWVKDGVPIDGATQARLEIEDVDQSHAGGYALEIWNTAGRVRTETLNVSVLAEPPHDPEPWNVAETDFSRSPTSIAYGRGRFVAVGDQDARRATLFVSPDGIEWTESLIGSIESWLEKVIFAGDLFVAVGKKDGQPVIMYSDNGVAWGYGTIDGQFSGPLISVAFGDGAYVAVGENVVLRSTDGVHWEPVTMGEDGTVYAVAFGEGTFLACGTEGTFSSPDGVSWEKQSDFSPFPPFAGAYHQRDLVYLKGRFWACAGESGLSHTQDGTAWMHTGVGDVSSLLEVGDLLMAVGRNFTHYGEPDGSFWATAITGLAPFLSVASSDDRIVAVGLDGFAARRARVDPRIVVEPDFMGPAVAPGSVQLDVTAVGSGPLEYQWLRNGEAIEGATAPSLVVESSVSTTAEAYSVAVSNSEGKVMSAEREVLFTAEPPLDPSAWRTRHEWDAGSFSSVTFGKGRFVAIGNGSFDAGSSIQSSREGNYWVGGPFSAAKYLRRVVFGDEKFVAVGEDHEGRGVIVWSMDGLSWRKASLPGGVNALASVACGNGSFLAVGASGGLWSEDGVTWQWAAGAAGASVAFANGRFVAVSETSEVVTSTDGRTWAPAGEAPMGGTDLHLVSLDNEFFLCSRDGMYATAAGESWQLRSPRSVFDLVRAAGVLVGVGEGYQVIYGTTDGLTWSDHETLPSAAVASLAVGNGRVVGVGVFGSIGFRTVEVEPKVGSAVSRGVTVLEGHGLELTVPVIVTDQELVYRWFWNGGFLEESTEPRLETEPLAPEDHGSEISLTVLNRWGQTLSEPIKVVVLVERYESWLKLAGLDDAPPEEQAFDADPGGVGIPNLLRYALGLPGQGSVRQYLPQFAVFGQSAEEPKVAVFSFHRRKAIRDVSLEVQISPDLKAWETLEEEDVVLSVEDQGSTEAVTLTYPVADSETLFFRLRSTLSSVE